MANFPGSWFEFVEKKEIIRLRKDINKTTALKVQVAASLIIALLTSFSTIWFEQCKLWVSIVTFIVVCLLILIIFFAPILYCKIKLWKNSNIFFNGKDAVTIFDEEIVYNVLAACEFSMQMPTITDSVLKNDLENFYKIEINYYVKESISKLILFNSNRSIYGIGRNKISPERAKNIIKLLDDLIKKHSLTFSNELTRSYNQTINIINSL